MSLLKKIYPWLLFVFLGTFAWGTSFFWIKIGLQELSPFQIVAWRLSFGALTLWLVASIRKNVHLSKELLFGSFILALLLMVVPITLITWSERYIPSSVAGLLNSLTPLFTIILSTFLVSTRQEISKQKLLGISLGFLGVSLIFMRNLTVDAFTHAFIPQLAVTIAAFLYAVGTLYTRLRLSNFDPIILSLYSLTWGAIMLWGIVSVADGNIMLPKQASTWLAITWLGIICSALATIIYMMLLKMLGSTIASSVAYLFPLTAFFLGVVMLGEKFSPRELVGGIAILSGIYIANSKRQFIKSQKQTTIDLVAK